MNIIHKKILRRGIVGSAAVVIMAFCVYSVVHAMSAGYFSGATFSGYGTYVFPKDFSDGVLAIPLYVGDSPTASENITRFEDFLKDYNEGVYNAVYNHSPQVATIQKKYGAAFIVCTMLGETFSSCKSDGYVNNSKTVQDKGWNTLDGRLNGPGMKIDWNTALDDETYGGSNGAFDNSLWDLTNDDNYRWSQTDPETDPPITFEHNGSAVYRLFRTCANPIGDLPGLPVTWTISPSSIVSQIKDSSGKPIAGDTTTAIPGDAIQWTHTIENTGPDDTDKSIYYDYTNQQGLATNGTTPKSGTGQKVDSGFKSDNTKSFTSPIYVVKTSDVGLNLCRATRVWSWTSTIDSSSSYDGVKGNGLTSTGACVLVSNPTVVYTLIPTVNISPDAIEAGATLYVSSNIQNTGPDTSSNPTICTLARQVNGVQTSTTPCNSSGFQGNHTTPGPSLNDTDTSNLSPGDQVCYILTLTPHSNTDSGPVSSSPACAVIGKKPKTEILGGDLIVGGNVATSTTTKDNSTYGSWAEYGIIASGGISGAASGAAFAGPGLATPPTGLDGPTFCQASKLSFANTPSGNATNTCTGDSGTVGYYTNDVAMPDVAASFPGTGNQIFGSVAPDSLHNASDDTYNAGNITLTQSTLLANETVIIKSTGTVTIAGNQQDSDGPYTNIDQLPQLIIIANKIVIDDTGANTVTRVDAWLVANNSDQTGSIYTCDNESGSETINDCQDQLQVNGPVMTDQLFLRRTAGADTADPSKPAEIFNLRADSYLWAIAHATTEGSIHTVDTIELPPRL
jgi:hypothetical protein